MMKDQEFILRKTDHIRHALAPESEAVEGNTLNCWNLIHDSLPDLALSEISIQARFLSASFRTPFFIAGMTAGHPDAKAINETLASAAEARGWAFGVGSQRRELDATFEDQTLTLIAKSHPNLWVISNLGIAQLIEIDRSSEWSRIHALLERAGSRAMAIHLNPLQEAIQKEGTTDFKGGLRAIESLISRIKIPVILKETGSGMSPTFLSRVASLPIQGVDVSGLGGTHWGRIEGMRASAGTLTARLGASFSNWGIPTAESILNAKTAFHGKPVSILASGGIRSGVDAAKCLALGAHAVGFARPALEAALLGREALEAWMETIEQELKVALFCTHSESLESLVPSKIERSPT